MQNFSSKLLENAVNQIAKLPGIGRRTAARLAIHLLQQPETETDSLTDALHEMRHQIHRCRHCHNLSDEEECDICRNPSRSPAIVCVVQDVRDVMAIENTEVFHGRYHLLGGVISPMNGIGPGQLQIESLWERLPEIEELILALPATTEGDTTAYYISKHLKTRYPQLIITSIARGVSVGNDLENIDEITLARSIVHRVEFETAF